MGDLKQPHLKPFLLRSTHPQQLRSQQDQSPLLPGVGGEVELMEDCCCCAGGSRQRGREPGGALLRDQGSLRGVGQLRLPAHAPLSGVRLVQGSA